VTRIVSFSEATRRFIVMAAGKYLRSTLPILNSHRSVVMYDYGGVGEIKRPEYSVIYVPGFQGTGHGIKSQSLIRHCQNRGVRYICYDPEGVGESSIKDFSQLQFKHWFEDAETVIQASGAEKIVLIGSSMGGWISMKMANQFPNKICAMLLIAPAVNFLRPKYDHWYKSSSLKVQKEQDEGKAHLMDPTYNSFPISRSFVEGSFELEIDLTKSYEIKCPAVKIIHGVQDDTVNYLQSIEVMNVMSSSKIELIFQKDGDHRMQNESGLSLIKHHLDDLLSRIS